jgi:hypothetical protein
VAAIFLAATGVCEENINKTIVKEIDITGDKIPNKIILNYFGKSINDPFSWTIKIYSDEKQIFESQEITYKADDVFDDPINFDNKCSDFKSCKTLFYDYELLEHAFSTQENSLNAILDKEYVGSVWYVSKGYLMNKLNMSEAQSNNILGKMVNELESRKVVLFFLPLSPFNTDTPVMYVKEVDGFVPVYAW